MDLVRRTGDYKRPLALAMAAGLAALAFLLILVLERLLGMLYLSLPMGQTGNGHRRWPATVRPHASASSIISRCIATELKAGLARGEFVPYYQPIVALPGGALVGFESLARWQHPMAGLIGADGFIREAEEAGLIHELSLALLERACADMRDWPAHLTLSINLSPLQLNQPWIAPAILKILWTHGIAPGRLMVELTESRRISDLPRAQGVIASLKAAGVKIALDDFGTGYSGLMRLRELSFDRIKIDRAFTGELARPENSEIVRAMLELGSGLGVSVVAEGVETPCAEAQLARLGCPYAQGFLYSPPISAQAVPGLIALSEEQKPSPAYPVPVEISAAPSFVERDRGRPVHFPTRASA